MTSESAQGAQITRRETIAKSRIFEVERMDVRFSNGALREFERLVSHRPSVMILPLLDPQTAVLVKEFAAGLNRYEWALPKGLLDPGETVTAAADREIQEEIGFAAHHLVQMGSLALSPHYMNHQTDWVLASGLYPKRLEGDEPEPLEPILVHRDDLFEYVKQSQIQDARSLAALFMWASGFLDEFLMV